MEILDVLALYQVQLDADGRAEATRRQYQRHVRLLDRWLREGDRSTAVDEVTHQVLAEFLVSAEARDRSDGKPKKATTTNTLRSSLRMFFAYAHAAGLTTTNAARLIRRARCGTAPPRGLSGDDQQRLLAALETAEGDAGVRDRVLFGLMLATGVRVGEVLALDVEDVYLDRGELLLRSTKGDRPRTVYLNDRAQALLRDYLGSRTSGPVFESRHGRRVSVRQVARRLEMWLERAGCRRASPHALRHAFGQGLYEQTRDPFLVQAAMGHRSIASTLSYVRAEAGRQWCLGARAASLARI